MANYTVAELASFCGGATHGDNRQVERLIIDSRKLFNPQGTLFVAIEGAMHNGHQYIDELYKKGVRSFVVSARFGREATFVDASFITVDDTTLALQQIAAAHRRKVGCDVVAITGSNGKTIVKEWVSHLLGDDIVNVRSPRSYNSQVGVPLSLWQLAGDTQLGIIEAGISRRGEMEKLEKMIAPNDVIITHIGPAHQENFKSIEEKLAEKLILCKNASIIFFNADNEVVANVVRSSYADKILVSWGRSDDAVLQIITCDNEQGQSVVNCNFRGNNLKLTIPFSDAASIENALQAVCYALYKGVAQSKVIDRCGTLEAVGMRLEQKEGHNNCLIIDDAYNNDLSSLEIALDFLHQQGNKKGLQPTLILSDIYQSGITDDELYSKVLSLAEEKGVKRIIGIGKSITASLDGRVADGRFFNSTSQFLAEMSMSDFHNEAILLKGARTFAFERIVEMLEQKRHRTVMEINLNALADNVSYVRRSLRGDTKILAMLKAFSYGSGSYEIASLMQHQKVDYLGVAFADEGYDMREAGITMPIIVMNPDVRSFGMMLDYDLEPEIYSVDMLREYARAVRRQGLNGAAIHIKIDTGMYRLGFLPYQMDELVDELKKHSNLYVKSVFSHLVGTDDAVHDDFTALQIERFQSACSRIATVAGNGFLRHILNSAGIERFPEAQFEMVRVGIGLYGISANDSDKLRNVATLKSYISQIKTVPAGESVGYSRKWVVKSDARIGVVPVGYADGLDRRLSNGVGSLLVGGKMVPIIGNVCMDMCMIDLTGVDAAEGDEVIVFGDDYPVWEMAKSVGTIPYEVLTGIGRRVKRIYFYE